MLSPDSTANTAKDKTHLIKFLNFLRFLLSFLYYLVSDRRIIIGHFHRRNFNVGKKCNINGGSVLLKYPSEPACVMPGP